MMKAAKTPSSESRRVLLALLAGGAVLYLTSLGATGFWAPDEPRYAQVAWELFSGRHGTPGLVVMHLNGEPYTQKPPLYYWLAALASLPVGAVTEWTARLPSALAGLACLWLAWRLGRRLFDERVGLWSAAVLLGVAPFTWLARRVQLDVLLTALVAGALLAWLRLDRGIGRRRAAVAAFHGCMGLAVLAKGPVGLLPLLVVTVYLASERRLRDWRRAVPAWGLALSLGPGLVWIAAAVALTPQGFFGEAIVENLLGRFFAGTSHHRPFYYYFHQLPLDFLPWTLAWPLVALCLRRVWRRPGDGDERRAPWRFLLAWAATYFVFFTLSAGKRGLYLAPSFPAWAVLCAASLVATLERRADLPRWLDTIVVGLAALAFTVGAAVTVAGGVLLDERSGFHVGAPFGAALALLSGAGGAVWLWQRRRAAPPLRRIAVLVVVTAGIQLSVFALLLPPYDIEKSPRPIAEAAAELAGPDEPIGVFRHRAMAGGLAFYARRRVVPLSSPNDVRAFVAAGGRVIAVRERYLSRLEPMLPVEQRAVFRSGRRAYALVTPASDSDTDADDAAAATADGRDGAPQRVDAGRQRI